METIDLGLTNVTLQFLCILIAFLVFYYVLNKAFNYLRNNEYLDSNKFLPEEETKTLKQIFYLIIISACFIYILSSLSVFNEDNFYLSLFDFILSTYCFLSMKKESIKDKILLFFLIPFASIDYLIVNTFNLLIVLDITHLIALVFVMRYFYKKFMDYTNNHGLGIAILLLYSIVFVSMIFTYFTEHVDLLDALVMSSNAFTSNGYTVLGKTIGGKLTSLLLVWGGYVISGVSTATLTAAILMKHFNKKFDELENLIKNEHGK